MQIHSIDKFENKIFNAGGGITNSLSLMEMTSICEKITGNKVYIESIPETRQADLRIFITDNTLINEETGWVPKKSVESVFVDIYNWIKENEVQLKPILG